MLTIETKLNQNSYVHSLPGNFAGIKRFLEPKKKKKNLCLGCVCVCVCLGWAGGLLFPSTLLIRHIPEFVEEFSGWPDDYHNTLQVIQARRLQHNVLLSLYCIQDHQIVFWQWNL